MTNQEFNRLRNKLSYQGESLQRRIKKQIKDVEQSKRKERGAKKTWLASQIAIMSAEDELFLLCKISNAERKYSRGR